MARGPRKKSSTGIYHVMIRGINKQNIFEDDEDRMKFLEIIRFFKNKCKYELYGYCLMNNHIHVLIKEMEDSISVAIARISATYVKWYNKKYERCGHLFQDRFKSEPINDEFSLLRVLRYIHQNPLKAGMAKGISGYKWTSYYEYIGKKNLVDIDIILDILSPDRHKSFNIYVDFMDEINDYDIFIDNDARLPISDDKVLDHIRSLGVSSISELQQMSRNERNDILKKLKELEFVTIRQLSRVTGISKSVIGRL